MGIVSGGGGGGTRPLVVNIPDGSTNALAVNDVDHVRVLTVGPGGEMTLKPDKNESSSLVSLQLWSQNHGNAFPLEVYDRAGTRVWYIDADGVFDFAVTGGSFDPATGNVLVVNNFGTALSVQKGSAADGNPVLLVRMGAQAIFRVDEDGALHGKTGKALTFDL